MRSPQITIVFWNIWEKAQSGEHDNGTKLQDKLDNLISTYTPDIFGLNEVLVDRKTGASPVLEYFKNRGYQTHFAPFSPMSEKWMIGNALISKQNPTSVIEHKLGNDIQAERRGHKGYHVKAIEGHFKIDGEDVAVVVNYLQSLRPDSWGTHVRHRRAYEMLLKNVKHKNIIIGGDFNEGKYLLPWLRMPRHLQRHTGTLRNPTWRWDGLKRRVVFANLDHMIWTKQGKLHLKKFAVLPRYPSDHAPLLGMFEVMPKIPE